MRNPIKLFFPISFLLLLLLAGCGSNSPQTVVQNPNSSAKGNVKLSIKIPDYSSQSLHAKVIDPATYTVEVNVSGPNMTSIQQSFDFARNGYWIDGYGYIDCTLTVPVGVDRVFSVMTRDSSDTELTAGVSEPVTVNPDQDNYISIGLLPCTANPIIIGTPISNQVDYGRMVYYRLDLNANQLCEIELSSSVDTNLFSFSNIGYSSNDSWKDSTSWIEKTMVYYNPFDPSTATYYIGIYGNSQGSNAYALNVKPITGTTFPNSNYNEVTPGTYSSIVSTGTQLWDTQPSNDNVYIKEIPIGFDFYFHDVLYTKLYVTQHAAVYFAPYNMNPINGMGNAQPPNDLIALFASTNRGYGLPPGHEVYYQLEGTAPNRRLIIEYDISSFEGTSDKLYGQIILNETTNSIELKYDRANSNIVSITGWIGVENEDGSATVGPGNVTGLPASDYQFILQ